ncbi:MAG: PAS domain-containing protein [Spirochaetales bacterium]|nr:PAS domain-containing protein [Spirochaetales bacterium]
MPSSCLLTKRKKTEKALKVSEIKFRTLVEQLPSVTYTAAIDEASTLLYISPQIEKLLGITPDEYKSSPDFWLKHLHDEDRDQVLEKLNITHKSSEPFRLEYRMILPYNRIVWIRDEAVIIKDDAGNPQYLQGVIFDITERKQNEEELKKYRKDLEELVKERTETLEKSRQSLTFLLEDVNETRLELEEKNKEMTYCP